MKTEKIVFLQLSWDVYRPKVNFCPILLSSKTIAISGRTYRNFKKSERHALWQHSPPVWRIALTGNSGATFRSFQELEEGHLDAGGMEPDVVAEHEHDPAEECQVVADQGGEDVPGHLVNLRG
jgi:hypothetical protein